MDGRGAIRNESHGGPRFVRWGCVSQALVYSPPRPDQVGLGRRPGERCRQPSAAPNVVVDHDVHWGVVCTVIGLATRGIMMIESCKVIVPTENQIPVAWNG